MSRPTRVLVYLYRYGAITLYGPAFLPVRVIFDKALAWSRFARHYYGSLG